jgi:pimeloyl-ACP methyl ester carboxylesterase
MYQHIEFESEGAALRGRFYSQGDEKAPCVVMAHGTSATITMVVDAYAEALHHAGFSVLLYDHRNFGISDGEPRYEINPWVQGRGYRDAVAYLRTRTDVGSIALWGDSYAGMVALVAGALIDEIAAVVAQIPACGVELPKLEPSDEVFQTLGSIFAKGEVGGGPESTTGPIPVVSSDQINAPSLLKPIQAYRWFIEHGGRFGTKWENCVTRVVPPTPAPFSAYLAAPYLRVPTLMMVGRDDEMIHCNPGVQRAVFEKISGPKEFYEVDGGHFGLLWHPGRIFDEAVERQILFLKDVLGH